MRTDTERIIASSFLWSALRQEILQTAIRRHNVAGIGDNERLLPTDRYPEVGRLDQRESQRSRPDVAGRILKHLRVFADR